MQHTLTKKPVALQGRFSAWGCCSKFYSTVTLTEKEPRTNHDKRIMWRKTMPVRDLSPSRVADQHPKRHATQICPHCRGGSVRRRCWRHKLTGLEQCMTMDHQAWSLRQHERAGEGYEMLATPRVSTRAHSLEVAHERWINRAVILRFLSAIFD